VKVEREKKMMIFSQLNFVEKNRNIFYREDGDNDLPLS
jgi:hypothetical protein